MGGRKDCFDAKIGTSFDAQRWLSLYPCGLIGISMTTSVHLFAYGVIACYMVEGSFLATAVFLLVYTPVAILALSSLYMAWTTDPGAVPMGARPLVTVKRAPSGELAESNGRRDRAIRRCHKCNDNFKPPRAHHDSVTGRCVVKFDHYCPWVGNAVGALNHKFFVLFVFYTMSSCVLTLFLMILRAIHCGHVKGDSSSLDGVAAPDLDSDNTDTEDEHRFLNYGVVQEECTGFHQSLAVLILLVVSFVFLIFTCCMLFEQLDTIETNASKIARMKMSVGQAGTELSRVTEEFNEMFGGDSTHVAWHWFWPAPVEFPRSMKKVVMGYEWDETFDPVPYAEPSTRDEEEGGNGNLELTTAGVPKLNLSSPSAVATAPSHTLSPSSNKEGEEGSFSGTPVVVVTDQAKPRLIKRATSRGPDGRMKSTGSLT